MFNDIITIYKHSISNGADVYSRSVIKGVYVMGGRALADSSKGIESRATTTIITNPENAQKYGSQWTLDINDKIVIGEGGTITTLKGLNALSVTSVSVNVCGSDVDNIEISCV